MQSDFVHKIIYRCNNSYHISYFTNIFILILMTHCKATL